jgi:hypothetical protein
MNTQVARPFLSWMVSWDIIRYKSNLKTNAKQHSFVHVAWGTFAYRKMPFGLKNVGATFQQAMYFAFHDLKHIAEAYLDDLES